MALPEAIPVRYSEDEAGYVSFRPVVRQTFRLHELLDMVLSVTGKDPARIRVILKSGTVVFHFYRYWWDGFDASESELSVLLKGFPDPDPSRPFSVDACTAALVESGATPARAPIELERAGMSHKRLLRSRSPWDALLAAAAAGPLEYHGYSYSQHADLYRLALSETTRSQLTANVESLAQRALRPTLRAIAEAPGIEFVCPRGAGKPNG